MSLPSFPPNDAVPSREEVMNQIISSIAMEELGLSHIINAEGEKIQYALGTIPGISGPEGPLTMDQLLELNKSVRSTLDSTMMNQFFLKEKLTSALTAATMQGPTGPTGPQGPATIALDPTVIALEPEVPPTVTNLGDEENVLLQFGLPRGATGAVGATGPTGATGAVPTVAVSTTQTVEPGSAANVTATPTATGVELGFQIPRGATGTAGATPTIEIGTTETVEPETAASVTATPTATGVELGFQIPRGATGAIPTIEIDATETVEPETAASVTATPTATGVELDFQIPRGATGAVVAEGMQVILNNTAGTELDIAQDGFIPFDEVVSSSGDIQYNQATGVITISTSQLNMIMVNWWTFVEGIDSGASVTLSLNANGVSYPVMLPWLQRQLSGSTMITVAPGVTSVDISLTNISGNTIHLANTATQAQLNVIVYRNA